MAGAIKLTGKINSYLTQKPPLKYFRENIYIVVMYDYGKNFILTKGIKGCEEK